MKYTVKRLSGLAKLKGKTFAEVFGVSKAKAMKRKMRLAKLGKKIPFKSRISKGKNHWNWKGGISRTFRSGYYSSQYKDWRKKVFERDNFTCQKCALHGSKGYLTAHHKKSFSHYPKLRYELSNGVTLCESCHSLTDNYKGRANRKVH